MSESLKINKSAADEEIYSSLISQIDSLIDERVPALSNLSNITAALKESFDKISWVGFYIFNGEFLYLGPFQGKTACTKIKIGNGVCGKSFEQIETIIVDDVDKFPGHIACDSGSRSEIVAPVIKENKAVAVLDLDSYSYSSFNDIDRKYLEIICKIISKKINFDSLVTTDK